MTRILRLACKGEATLFEKKVKFEWKFCDMKRTALRAANEHKMNATQTQIIFHSIVMKMIMAQDEAKRRDETVACVLPLKMCHLVTLYILVRASCLSSLHAQCTR